MNFFKSFKRELFFISDASFSDKALQLFQYQAQHNLIYLNYLTQLHIDPYTVKEIEEIPFMPIDFFKAHDIQTGSWTAQTVFKSSGTTGQTTSRHLQQDLNFYHQVSRAAFIQFYSALEDFHILALLPSYLERSDSSLVDMAGFFIKESKSPHSGFYLDQKEGLISEIIRLSDHPGKILLFGVSFALLDLAQEISDKPIPELMVMETGGMKGRRPEMVRSELHQELKKAFKVDRIHSEYGMTELLSQAYSSENGMFKTPPWMRVLIREINDPFQVGQQSRIGGINIIDLANVHSCAFIETQDLGLLHPENSFEVLGRLDNSDLRGCNLLV